MTDANIGGGDFIRPALQRAGGQRFRFIDGEPRPPSTEANSVSPIANSESSASASAIGHSKQLMSAPAATVDGKSSVFFRKSQLKLRKIKHHLDQIDEYKKCATNDPQTEAASLSSSSSFDEYSSFPSFNTLSSFPSAAVDSYSALIKEFRDDARGSQVSCLTTNSAQIKESTFPMANRELSAAVDAVEQSQNPTSSLAATGRQSDVSTFSSPSFRAFKNFVFDNKQDEALSELVSSLQETNIQQENTIQQLMHHITKIECKLQSQSESTKVQPIGSTHKPSNDPPAQSDDPNDSLYQLQMKNNDLTEKIVLSTYANGQLLSKCQRLEKYETQHKELLVLVEDLRAENNDIRKLVSRMKEELVDFAHVHVDCMKGYETQLASLKDEKHRAESIEIDEAYQLCEVLQQEIDMLRNFLEELRGRVGSGSKENDSKGEGEHKLSNLSPKIVSWANDNCPRIEQQPSNVLCDGQDDVCVSMPAL